MTTVFDKKPQELILQLLPGKMGEETQARWVEELIQNGLKGLDRLHVSDKVQEAQVITAFPLKANEKSALKDQLSKQLGRSIHFKEQTDPGLILGLRLTIDSLVIDGSLEFKIQEILRHAKSQNIDRG